MPTTILKCSCQHPYQDRKYGRGKRVHNESDKGKEAICTVCGNKKNTK